MKRTLSWISVLLILIMLIGCSTKQVLTTVGVGAAVAGAAAAVYYVRGDLEADLSDDIESVHEAALAVMEDRDYLVTEEVISSESGRIKAEIPAIGDEKARTVTIKHERKTEQLTHISIRVGTFGDEVLSRSTLTDIEQEL